jgi:hypothetical protein
MEKRQIKMQDGRYLIFYTFAQKSATAQNETIATEDSVDAAKDSEPVAKPVAEEERSV